MRTETPSTSAAQPFLHDADALDELLSYLVPAAQSARPEGQLREAKSSISGQISALTLLWKALWVHEFSHCSTLAKEKSLEGEMLNLISKYTRKAQKIFSVIQAVGCSFRGFVCAPSRAAYSPVSLRHVNHAFSPLPAEQVRSL